MAAATRKPVAKRKVSDSDSASQPPGKKSPLCGLPQNYYAPPSVSSMTKEELSAWRKEQRRKRNRESAAASRNKTRARVAELEGEVNKWRGMYHDMEARMKCMERHIQFLTKLNQSQGVVPPPPTAQLPPAPVVSHPNSPPRSPQPYSGPAPVPQAVTSSAPPPPAYSSHANPALFPPLLSQAKPRAKVEKVEAPVAVKPAVASAPKESKEHIIPISRQA